MRISFALMACALASSAAAQAVYVVTPFQTAPGYTSRAVSVTWSRNIAWNVTEVASGQVRAYFKYVEQWPYPTDQIPTLGGPSLEARRCGGSISSYGQAAVVGTSRISNASSDSHAFLWWHGGTTQPLPHLAGNYSVANDITSLNWICGGARDAANAMQPVYWLQASPGYAVNSLPLPAGATAGEALDFDANGFAAAGWVTTAAGTKQACIWTDLNTPVLPLAAQGESVAHSCAYVPGGTPQLSGTARPFPGAPTSSAFCYDGTYHDLGTLGGSEATLLAGNSTKGVGESLDASGNKRAFVCSHGQLIDLNTLIPPGSGWVLESANDFANSAIVGYGKYLGVETGFVLDPMPPSNYCTAGTSSAGCIAQIYGLNAPSLSGSSFQLRISALDAQHNALIFYGVSGQQAVSWGTTSSFLCVKPPTQRMPLQSSGGTAGTCSGLVQVSFFDYMNANPGALGMPLYVGESFDAQGWYRDPGNAKTSSLTNALHFVLAP